MKNELVLKGTQEFMGKEIQVITGGFGENQKVVTDKMISEIHGMENKNVRARITDNIKRFKENVDIIDLKQRACEISTLDLTQFGYAKQSITQAKNIYLLSERGYAKLIKIMDTDLAWEIHDKLIDEYFTMREVINSSEHLKALALLRAVETTGEESVIAIKKYVDIRVEEETKPLLEEIHNNQPYIELAKKRIDTTGLVSVTEVNDIFECKRGKITGWLKANGYLHKTRTEVNEKGKGLFRICVRGGFNCVGVTEEGLQLINDNIDKIKDNKKKAA